MNVENCILQSQTVFHFLKHFYILGYIYDIPIWTKMTQRKTVVKQPQALKWKKKLELLKQKALEL